jgi:hypothetical protein
MSLRKHGLEVLGLGIMAALALMAFGASAAQATDSGVWLENEKAITSLLTATGEVDTLLRLEAAAVNIEIDCSAFIVKQGDLLGSGAGESPGVAHVELLLTGCKANTLSPLAEQVNCKLYESALDREKKVNAGNLLVRGLALVFLHTDGVPYIRVHGVPPENIIITIFAENCIGVPNGTKVRGLEVFKVTKIEKRLLLEMASLTLFPNELVYGGSVAELLGSIMLDLTNNELLGIC